MTRKAVRTILFSALIMIVMTSATILPAQAAPTEDPYEHRSGQLQITKTIVGDSVTVDYTFTSDGLKQKYGDIKLYRQETLPIGDKQITEGTITKTVEMKLIHANNAAELDAYQQIKNDGFPIHSHLKWDILVSTPVTTTTHNTLSIDYSSNTAQIQPMTHEPNWTHKDQMYSPSDPINIIWNDSGGVPENIAQEARNNLVLNGWTESSICPGLTQYINYLGAWIPQEYQVYDVSDCDRTHVRIWDLTSDRAIGGSHAEIKVTGEWEVRHFSGTGPSGTETQIDGHVVTDFESAETQVNNEFSGCWTAYPDNHWMDNEYTREYWQSGSLRYSAYNDGYASQINKSC